MTNESAESSRKKIIALVVALLALVLVAAGVWLAYRPAALPLQGMADADSLKVSAKISARIAQLHVREGDQVEAGQLLFTLHSPEVEAKYQQAEAVLQAAQAQASKANKGAREEQLRAAKANWLRADAGAELANATAARLDNLFNEGVVSRQRRDEAQTQAANASQLAAAARAQYDEALAGAREQDKATADAQVKQAQAVLAEVQAAREELLGRAPVAGEVSKRLADSGELVPAGYPMFMLSDTQRLWVSVFIREDEFHGLANDTVLSGYIPALNLRADFRVYYISPAGDFATWRATRQSAGYDVRSFEVRLTPVAALAGFRPGMSVLLDRPR